MVTSIPYQELSPLYLARCRTITPFQTQHLCVLCKDEGQGSQTGGVPMAWQSAALKARTLAPGCGSARSR